MNLGWVLIPALAQGDAGDRHKAAVELLKRRAAEISAECLSEVGDWKNSRPEIRRRMLSMLGLDPLPNRTPLRAKVTGILRRPKYRIEKIVFQSSPGLYITSNLYVPEAPAGRLAAILYVSGHSPHPLGAKWSYQDRAVWFAEHGYVAFVLDTLEFGEVPGIHHGIHDLNMFHWLSLGYTPVGVEVWNAIRAIDYLQTRPEVDSTKIGMTGISGGGAVTWYTSAVEERVAAAVPVCSTIALGSQAAHWVASGQCDCIYYHNTFETDFPTVGALIAPRPLLILSGRKDPDFPPDGYHEVFSRSRRVYELYGASDRIRELDDDVGHTDAPVFLKEARQWMNRWLKGDEAPLAIEPPGKPQETAEDLSCLADPPPDAVNDRIHDTFVPAAKPKTYDSLESWKARREELLKELREKCFRWFPRREIPFETKPRRNSGGWAARYAEYSDACFETEPGLPIRAQMLRPRVDRKQDPWVIYVKRAGDSIYPLDLDELLPILGLAPVMILNPRLTERSISASEYAEIERTASWVGRTVASMQVWDVIRAVQWALREERRPVALYAKGEMAAVALYAALLDDSIERVILRDPPVSHWQGPAILNILRVTDLPEAAAALAPRKLFFVSRFQEPYPYTKGIYSLWGKPEALRAAASLAEALK